MKKFKGLVDKMDSSAKARVKAAIKKEEAKISLKAEKAKIKIKPKQHTTQFLFGKYRMLITQGFCRGEDTGHYILVLMDKKDNLLVTGGSDGAKERLTPKDIQALGYAARNVYLEILAERS